jgi:hypothetical protein
MASQNVNCSKLEDIFFNRFLRHRPLCRDAETGAPIFNWRSLVPFARRKETLMSRPATENLHV